MITSHQNPKIQYVKSLLGRARERREAGRFVVEGVRLAEEALAGGWLADLVLVSEDLSPRGREAAGQLAAGGAEVEPVSADVMRSLSDTQTSQGILVVLRIQPLPLPEKLDFLLVVDAVRDPGNLGTLLRSAAASGAGAVVLSPGTVDPYSPKVVRSGMGAQFRLPVLECSWEEIASLLHGGAENRPRLQAYLAEADKGTVYWQADLRLPVALIVGGEAEGATPEARKLADAAIRIPMPGRFESLNAAVAGSILLFEVVRQR